MQRASRQKTAHKLSCLIIFSVILSTLQASKPTFVNFYNENKGEFEKDNPSMTPAELTKYAMNKFRLLYPVKGDGTASDTNDDTNKSTTPNAKRKINNEDIQGSGVAKLARFSFKKQA